MSDPILDSFFEEADERLLELEDDLLRLEQNPTDAEVLNRIFRCAHTLKGNSGMLGLDDMAHFTHALEDLLDLLRKGLRLVTPEIVNTLLASRDALKHLVAVAKGQEKPSPDATIGTERLLRSFVDDARATIQEPKSPAPAPAAVVLPTSPPPTPTNTLTSAAGAGAAGEAFGFFEPIAPPAETTPSAPAASARSVPSPSDTPTGNEPAAARASQEPAPQKLAASPTAAAAPIHGESASIRVPVEKVDRLLNLVGELVITQSMIAQALESKEPGRLDALQDAVAQMDRHARELHERMMAIRMVPIRTLFARFPRLVRDLSGLTRKQVVLETSGEETELDKTVIEHITDPLTHLVRNSIDHGIELPEERRAAGKQEQATVRIAAYQRGSSVYIEVSDDGRGIDRARIKAKAIATGLIPPDAVLTDDQTLQLVFKPGLSTAAKVTEISGRGVGMDVVKRNVESLGGQLAIKSEPGQGTLIQIKLPLTLAIMDGQVVSVGDQAFVVPLVAITESVRPTSDMLHQPAGSPPFVVVRDQVMPILALHERFEIEPRSRRVEEGLLMIVESESQLAAILVDELHGQQQVVVKNLERNYRRIHGVGGATILGDGRVALILDIAGLLELQTVGA